MVAVVVWALVLARAVPGVQWDRGVFVSTAERLRAGNRLYADVWDNKDPLFHYALGRWRTVSPLSDMCRPWNGSGSARAGTQAVAFSLQPPPQDHQSPGAADLVILRHRGRGQTP